MNETFLLWEFSPHITAGLNHRHLYVHGTSEHSDRLGAACVATLPAKRLHAMRIIALGGAYARDPLFAVNPFGALLWTMEAHCGKKD
jgi:hypothetical protein